MKVFQQLRRLVSTDEIARDLNVDEVNENNKEK